MPHTRYISVSYSDEITTRDNNKMAGGVDLQVLLMGMLAAALRGHRGDSALHDLVPAVRLHQIRRR
jgi:hypothetical protein